MDDEQKAACLDHLRAALRCFENGNEIVLAARLSEIIDGIEGGIEDDQEGPATAGTQRNAAVS